MNPIAIIWPINHTRQYPATITVPPRNTIICFGWLSWVLGWVIPRPNLTEGAMMQRWWEQNKNYVVKEPMYVVGKY